MARVPSIKGSVFGGVVEAVQKLLAEGELSREQAGRWLEPGDLSLLDGAISMAGWYDIRIFDRFTVLWATVSVRVRHLVRHLVVNSYEAEIVFPK